MDATGSRALLRRKVAMPDAVFFLAVFGAATLARVAAQGTIFYRKPLSCPLCMGFWIALTIWPFRENEVVICFAYAFAAAGVSWTINKYVTGNS